jgi:hypothetical protein
MASSSGDNIRYPSMASVLKAGNVPLITHDFLRLRWFVRGGPPEDRLKVLTNVYDKDSAQEPYLTRTTASDDNMSLPAASTPEVQLHPVASGSITNPPVSSVSVTISVLKGWYAGWWEAHKHHPDDQLFRAAGDQRSDGSDDGRYDPDGAPKSCPCGSVAPGPGPEIVVEPAGGRPFVTVGDYVATLHPWLVEHEALIRDAALSIDDESLDEKVELFILPNGVHSLYIKWGSYDTEWQKVAFSARLRRVPVGGVHPDEMPSTQPLHMAPPNAVQGPSVRVYTAGW